MNENADQREHESLAKSLAEGLAQADRGELRDGAEVIEELRSLLGRRRDEQREPPARD